MKNSGEKVIKQLTILYSDLKTAKELVYDPCGYDLKNLTIHSEGSAYNACSYELDGKIMKTKKDGWRDNIQKTKAVRYAIEETLKHHRIEHPTPEYVLNIVRKQQDY